MSDGWSVGAVVSIQGLAEDALNGCLGEVMALDAASGRLDVRLRAADESDCWRQVPPENLRAGPPAASVACARQESVDGMH